MTWSQKSQERLSLEPRGGLLTSSPHLGHCLQGASLGFQGLQGPSTHLTSAHERPDSAAWKWQHARTGASRL